MSYIAAKHMHLTFVLLSIVLFYIRAFSRINSWKLAKNKVLFISGHLGDTLLLLSAFYLTYLSGFNPVQHPWLLEKLFLVICYIALGFVLLKQTAKINQYLCLTIATSCLLAIGYLAGTKNPFIF